MYADQEKTIYTGVRGNFVTIILKLLLDVLLQLQSFFVHCMFIAIAIYALHVTAIFFILTEIKCVHLAKAHFFWKIETSKQVNTTQVFFFIYIFPLNRITSPGYGN